MNYQQYLQSPEWLITKQAALHRAEYKCHKCSFGEELDVHHLTYANIGNERDEDLEVLCRRCHSDAHYFAEHRDITQFAKEVLMFGDITEDEYEKAKLSIVRGEHFEEEVPF